MAEIQKGTSLEWGLSTGEEFSGYVAQSADYDETPKHNVEVDDSDGDTVSVALGGFNTTLTVELIVNNGTTVMSAGDQVTAGDGTIWLCINPGRAYAVGAHYRLRATLKTYGGITLV